MSAETTVVAAGDAAKAERLSKSLSLLEELHALLIPADFTADSPLAVALAQIHGAVEQAFEATTTVEGA